MSAFQSTALQAAALVVRLLFPKCGSQGHVTRQLFCLQVLFSPVPPGHPARTLGGSTADFFPFQLNQGKRRIGIAFPEVTLKPR